MQADVWTPARYHLFEKQAWPNGIGGWSIFHTLRTTFTRMMSSLTHKATFELSQFSILETVIFGQNTGDLRPINRCLLPTNRSARRCVAERLWSSCQCRRGRAGLRTAHDQFTLTGGITHHGCRIVRKHARHRGPDPVDIPF